MYQSFQEPRNCRLARGVEPLSPAALLTPIDGAKDGPEPTVAASPAAFFFVAASSVAFFATASSAAFFLATASSAAFFTTVVSSVAFITFVVSSVDILTVAASATSFSAVALVATTVSPADELPLEGANWLLVYLCRAPSSAFVAKHHHQMILNCCYG
jgi:hypothetical protein